MLPASGHMIVLDQTTTGDGLVCALQVLAVMKQTGKRLSELVAGMARFPQSMVNVRTDRRIDPASSEAILKAVAAAESELADAGRIVLRASGTEPVIRVMVTSTSTVGLPRESRTSLAKTPIISPIHSSSKSTLNIF